VTFWFDLGGAAGVISLEEMKIMVVGYQERLMVKLVVVLERLWINGLTSRWLGFGTPFRTISVY
jgi:hypothetical protein